MQGVEVQPHLKIGTKDAHELCIVVGDPGRAELLAKMCDEAKEVAYNREYRTYRCVKDGQTFLCTSHGVGSGGAAICFEELIACGVKVIVRAGTAGALQPGMKQGDLVIVHSAACDEGVSTRIMPAGMPAVGCVDVYNHIKKTASDLKFHARGGMSLSTDTFYASPVTGSSLATYAKAKVDIVEMEISALYNICRLKGVLSGAICTIDGNPLKWQADDADASYHAHGDETREGKERMLQVAIKSAAGMVKDKIWEGEHY
eukprot:Polyplicarium_translucidae@DN922_c0_g1_i1.p2